MTLSISDEMRQMEPSTSAPADRVQWAASMRQRFSPAGMQNPDGSINQDFFKPKRVLLVNERKWGDAERDALYRGLEKHGVGKWRQIGEELLPGWDDQQIRIKVMRPAPRRSCDTQQLGTWSTRQQQPWGPLP